MLAAYETVLQQGAKDEAEWQRTRAKLYAEPRAVKRERLRSGGAAPAAPRVGLTVGSVEALLAGAAATDALYGT